MRNHHDPKTCFGSQQALAELGPTDRFQFLKTVWKRGRRINVISGSLIWSTILVELIFNPSWTARQVKWRKGWRMSSALLWIKRRACDVGEAKERLENELWCRWSNGNFSKFSVTSPMSQLIFQPFRCFTYITVHSPTLLSLLVRHKLCSFSNPSVTLPTSQLILQPFRRFTYVTADSPTLPLLHLRHSSFSNPSFASLRHKLFT